MGCCYNYNKEKVDLARKSIRENIEKGIQITTEQTKLNLSFSDEYIIDSNIKTVDQSIEVVRKRVDESGTKEPVIQNKVKKGLSFNFLVLKIQRE